MDGIQTREDCATPLRLHLLGTAEAALDGRPIAFRTKKALALLAYLALDPGPHQRERLADLLWPSADAGDARASLRTALNYIRQALGCHADRVLTASRDMLGLMPGSLELDVEALAHARRLARGAEANTLRYQIETVADRYHGPFLAGLMIPDAPDFEAWIEAQRTYWSGVEAELLDRLAAQQLAEGDPAAAISALERWTSLNPDEETAWRRLIEAHLRVDDVAGARRAWSRYSRIMVELDARPSRQMAELSSRILAPHDTHPLSGPAATVTLDRGPGSWKTRLLAEFLKSIGSGEPEVAELERWLTEVRRDSATVRLELKTTVDDDRPMVMPELAFAI